MTDKVFVFDFPLPTWNRILAMKLKERMKLKRLIHSMISISIQLEKGLETSTASQQKRLLMDSLKKEYLQTIRPPKSAVSPLRKKKAVLRKRYSRSRR